MATNPIIAANTRFAAKLFGELTKQADENVFFSPLSITLALLLAHGGAESATEKAIEDVLGLERISHERAAREAGALIAQLAALDEQEAQRTGRFGEVADTVWLRIANALFVNRNVVFKQQYVQSMRSEFGAAVESLDFGSAKAAETIDAWVSEQTRGKISEIAGTIGNDVAAVLLNVIYFKAPWSNPFPEQATQGDNFTLHDGKTMVVPMMSNTDRYLYGHANGFEVVGLPFAGGGELRMLVVLPARASEITALHTQVADPTFFANIHLRSAQVRLRMPRFKTECDINLNTPLITLGMGVAFDSQRADFSRMASESLHISEVRHKTFLDVNEKGAEAAAATAIKMMRMSLALDRPIEVNVNRPFVVAIQEQQSGALLFLGSILRP